MCVIPKFIAKSSCLPQQSLNHVPVLLSEIGSFLCGPVNGGHPRTLLDATVGLGGHTSYLMQKFPSLDLLIGIDRDAEALQRCNENLRRRFPDTNVLLLSGKTQSVSCLKHLGKRRVLLLHDVFDNIGSALDRAGIKSVDCLLMDLGVSSLQLDSAQRGFAFRFDGPLDMRMNQHAGEETALQLIANSTVESLTYVLERYGEERLAKRIADRILQSYAKGQLNSTFDLERICWDAYPVASRPQNRKASEGRQRKMIHPATRTFMALRVAVNNELSLLESALRKISSGVISPGGRLGVISFHSLEDRIVKHTFRSWKASNLIHDVVTKKPIQASELEINSNPRSRSAKLRICSWPDTV